MRLKVLRPRTFVSCVIVRHPRAAKRRDRSQMIDVPVAALVGTRVPPNTGADASRTQRTADVQVRTGMKIQCA